MDKMCDGHLWCTTKSTNFQNKFELSFQQSTCAGHLEYLDDYYQYMHCNRGVCNNTEWTRTTPVALDKFELECKVCHLIPMCIALYHARIIYIHSSSLKDVQGLYSSSCARPSRLQWNMM